VSGIESHAAYTVTSRPTITSSSSWTLSANVPSEKQPPPLSQVTATRRSYQSQRS
jgi:hypothetical protein